MARRFEVTWKGTLPATPEEAWDALTRRSSAWLWEVEYEPRVGGAESGLNDGGGIVTAWDPGRHFATKATNGFNELEYRLTPHPHGTHLDYVHRGEIEGDYDLELDACERHTAFYYDTLTEYLAHFKGLAAAYMTADLDGATYADVRRALGVPEHAKAGDRALLGVIDHVDDRFLGIRAEDALIRVFGRDGWGWPVGVTVHAFANADRWSDWLTRTFDREAVA